MGWVKLTELNDRPCLGVRFTYDEVQDIDNSGNYNFSRQEDVKDPAFGTWGSAFRFDTTAKNVCDPAVKGGSDVFYMIANGQYDQVTVMNGVVEWMWSEPVYYWGFGSRDAVEDSFDPTPYAADYIYVLVDDGNDDGGGDDGGGDDDGGDDGNTDAVTIADNLNRIIQAKADIKSAIEEKGVVVGDGTIDTYADKISAIPQEINQSKWIIPDGTRFMSSDWSSLDASSWDVSNVTDMSSMFSGCDKLTSLNVSNWDVSNVTNMIRMFEYCTYLTLLDVSNWDTSNVTNMGNMFGSCFNLTSLDVSNWDTSNVGSMQYMFQLCTNLTSLDLSGWDTSKVIYMYSMFSGCKKLTSVGDLSSWDTSKLRDMDFMFSGCDSLTSLNLTSWDLSAVLGVTDMFKCENLTNLQFGNNLKTSISFSYCTQLTVESLLSIINGLYDFTGNGQTPTSSQGKLTLGSTNLAKLTDNQKTIATNKGWVLS